MLLLARTGRRDCIAAQARQEESRVQQRQRPEPENPQATVPAVECASAVATSSVPGSGEAYGPTQPAFWISPPQLRHVSGNGICLARWRRGAPGQTVVARP